jgi:hypothetical protein
LRENEVFGDLGISKCEQNYLKLLEKEYLKTGDMIANRHLSIICMNKVRWKKLLGKEVTKLEELNFQHFENLIDRGKIPGKLYFRDTNGSKPSTTILDTI